MLLDSTGRRSQRRNDVTLQSYDLMPRNKHTRPANIFTRVNTAFIISLIWLWLKIYQ